MSNGTEQNSPVHKVWKPECVYSILLFVKKKLNESIDLIVYIVYIHKEPVSNLFPF